ncbi:MAG: aminodeoxychorismate/anthranilate synthase component II [Chloroflexi bacterium]|nr:aminodeoxychorismate/anthranilate synthase component II [Chloroflexota bacterium]
MILIVDNYDSFVYNLAQYIGELGWEPDVYRNDSLSVEQVEEMAPSHIVISPGPGTPLDAGISNDVIERLGGKVPILGVCLGHQCIGHVYGGEIVRAPKPMHGKKSEIFHDGKTVYRGIPNPFVAARYHSLVIDPSSVPECLEVTARTQSGEIMGVRHREFVVEGVQYHPESILTEVGHDLLRNFLDHTGARWAAAAAGKR